MNRTIKFRVWNKARNKWEHGPHENPSLDGVNLFGECILLGGFVNVPMNELGSLVALQYTGLKDKNGREIFEGDIVKHSNEDPTVYKLPAEVSIGEYSTHCGEFKHFGVRAKRLDISTYFGLFEDCEKFEVVGNVFENPELLKQ